MSALRKAVVPAAGLGTRFLPATKALPKEMVPLVDKPAIQYVVEEAVRAGVTDILVVTGRGKQSLEDHFDRSIELEQRLEAGGKLAELCEVRGVAELAQVHFVRQGEPKGLGHAVSVAKSHVGDEPFAVLLPDDLLSEHSGVLGGMLAAFERHRRSVIALIQLPIDVISTKGAAAVSPVGDGLFRIHQLVEKPPPGEAPSDLAVLGRYVLTPGIFAALDQTAPGKGGEIQLTDAINRLLESEEVYGYRVSDGYYDVGNTLGYLRATVGLALERPDLAEAFRNVLAEAMRRHLSDEARRP